MSAAGGIRSAIQLAVFPERTARDGWRMPYACLLGFNTTGYGTSAAGETTDRAVRCRRTLRLPRGLEGGVGRIFLGNQSKSVSVVFWVRAAERPTRNG